MNFPHITGDGSTACWCCPGYVDELVSQTTPILPGLYHVSWGIVRSVTHYQPYHDRKRHGRPWSLLPMWVIPGTTVGNRG